MPRSIKIHDRLVGQRVILRASLNAPMRDGVVEGAARILEALPTIMYLRERGARVIIIAHRSGEPAESLFPIYEHLSELLPLSFVADLFSDAGKEVLDGMRDGDVALAENIRMYPEEEKNDAAFARKMAGLADVFVNDDFTVAHRNHATVVTLPKLLPSFMGFRFEEELLRLTEALTPPRPATLILGGAKAETKIPIAAKLSDAVDTIVLSGVSGNAFLKTRGDQVGLSKLPATDVPEVSILEESGKVLLPVDVVVRTPGGETRTCLLHEVGADDMIVDLSKQSIEAILSAARASKYVLWNGPVGIYEEGFVSGTEALARGLCEMETSVIVGGGDTVAAIEHLNLGESFAFVSTAGGAMLDFLANSTLPGIEALDIS